mgnify:CR=1 FL=1
MVVDWITVSDGKKNKKQIKTFKNLPYAEFYFYAFKGKDIFLVGSANQDTSSKMIKVNNRKFRKGNNGTAFKNNGIKCLVYSEVDENSLGNRSYTGNVKVFCDDNTKYVGNWVQYQNKGSGTAIDSASGENIDFSFAMNKNLALADLNKSNSTTKIAKQEPKEIEKKEIEQKYNTLQQENQTLKQKFDDFKKKEIEEKKREDQFSEKIDELNQETDNLMEEIDKWQM